MMNKNDITEVVIEDLTKDGEGIGHVNGYTLFVKHALVGDRVKAVVTRPKKTYAYAKTLEVLEASPNRVEAACPHAKRCGGCSLQELAYPAQLAWKQKYVSGVMRKIGGFEDLEVLPVLGMDEPYRYRNKAQYPVAMVDGVPKAGFYGGHSHSLIPLEDCLLTDAANARITKTITDWMQVYHVRAYDETTGKGLVRHILIRRSAASGDMMVCLIINGKRVPHSDELVASLTKIPGIVSISLNSNTKKGNVILGDAVIPLYGEPCIEDTLGGLTFRISPKSFYQVNPTQTEVLYGNALEAAGLTGDEVVYDLYCGIGTISLFLAKKAKKVYGVEIVPDAIRDAKENAARNGISNAEFYVGAAEELVTRGYFEEGVPCPRPDVVVLDPPRKGCDPSLVEAVLQFAPEKIVYVSCDPATLARDLKLFCAGDGKTAYLVKAVQPVDMFPQTMHVETVVLMSRIQD